MVGRSGIGDGIALRRGDVKGMNKQLMFSVGAKDLKWDYFRAGGKGGQKQNKTDSGARVTHIPSGVACEAREQRSQVQNRRSALAKLAAHPKFVLWCKMQAAANADGYASIAAKVDEMMDDRFIKTETAPDCVAGEAYCDVNGDGP